MRSRIGFTEHVVDRFQERFRPGLGFEAARTELGRLTVHGELRDEPPAWMGESDLEPAAGYLMIGDDLLLVLQRKEEGLVAVTCLGRGTLKPSDRTRRRRDRNHRQRERNIRKRRSTRPRAYDRTPSLT